MGRMNAVRRVNVPLSAVPVHVRRAFIATEDRRFYQHDGLDWIGVGRAIVRNTLSLRFREGFSTITMQVARNTFLADRATGARSIGRKLLELRVARLLERALTKDEILELYVNAIYLGNGVYGVEGASRDLFGKRVRDLNLAEGALLAALPKGPSIYTPRRNPGSRAREAQPRARAHAGAGIHRASRHASRAARGTARTARVVATDGFTGVIRDRPGEGARGLGAAGTRRGTALKSLCTRPSMPSRSALPNAPSSNARWRSSATRRVGWPDEDAPDAGVQGAMVALDPRTGDIRAMVGGRTHARGAFNRAVRSLRQPGSAFKPFVYAAALSCRVDASHGRRGRAAGSGPGQRRLLDAGELRRRVRRVDDASSGADAVVEHRHGARQSSRWRDERGRGGAANGIVSPLRAVPSVALGSIEVTPLELVTAYAPVRQRRFARHAKTRQAHRAHGRHADLVLGACAHAGDGSARCLSDDVDAARRSRRRHGPRASATWVSTGRSPGRRGRRTMAPTPGSSAIRRCWSPASGSATTRRIRSATRRAARAWRHPHGCVSTATDGANAAANGPYLTDWCPRRSTCRPAHSPASGAHSPRANGSVSAPNHRTSVRSTAPRDFPSWIGNLDDEIAERVAAILRRFRGRK